MLWDNLRQARILIVDDELQNVRLLEQLLQRNGYESVRGITDSASALSAYIDFQPDVLLLDLNMPKLDGWEVMRQIKLVDDIKIGAPILVLTADITPEAKQKALSGGAKDFLTKPLDLTEVLLRINNLLETRALHLQLREQNTVLENTVRMRTQELRETHLKVLERLARAAEFRDDDTGQHTQRVGAMSARLARALGISEQRVELIFRAAPLHDVGKIGISDAVLLKPGKLTEDEFAVMKTHTTVGAALLGNGRSDLILLAECIALSHHEKWDGNGYPFRLSGDDIPMEGRILAVVDVFDALTHDRSYKKAWPIPLALAEIETQIGKHFDPVVGRTFFKMIESDMSQ